jgi:hypothetical protein
MHSKIPTPHPRSLFASRVSRCALLPLHSPQMSKSVVVRGDKGVLPRVGGKDFRRGTNVPNGDSPMPNGNRLCQFNSLSAVNIPPQTDWRPRIGQTTPFNPRKRSRQTDWRQQIANCIDKRGPRLWGKPATAHGQTHLTIYQGQTLQGKLAPVHRLEKRRVRPSGAFKKKFTAPHKCQNAARIYPLTRPKTPAGRQ